MEDKEKIQKIILSEKQLKQLAEYIVEKQEKNKPIYNPSLQIWE